MSPENTHKLIGIYMDGIIITLYGVTIRNINVHVVISAR